MLAMQQRVTKIDATTRNIEFSDKEHTHTHTRAYSCSKLVAYIICIVRDCARYKNFIVWQLVFLRKHKVANLVAALFGYWALFFILGITLNKISRNRSDNFVASSNFFFGSVFTRSRCKLLCIQTIRE